MLRNYIVYDDSCSLCRMWKNLVVRIDVRRCLEPISIPKATKLGLLDSIAPSNRWKSFHLVTRDGLVLSAEGAIPVLIGVLLNAKWLGGPVAGSKRLTYVIESVYEFLAEAKHRSNCGQSCPAEFDDLR